MTLSLCQVNLEGLRFYAYHGVLPQERVVGGHYTVDLSLELTDYEDAVCRDQLSATVNYATVYQIVAEQMAIPSDLLEHAAGRILQALFDNFSTISAIAITLRKDTPPIGADIQGCSVTLNAKR